MIDLRHLGLGRRSLLTKDIIEQYGINPPDAVVEAVLRDVLAKVKDCPKQPPVVRDIVKPLSRTIETPAQLADWYLVYKAGSAVTTLSNIELATRGWLEFCQKHGIDHIGAFDTLRAQEYFAWLVASYKPGTCNNRRSQIKSMYTAAVDCGILAKSPVTKWPPARRVAPKVKFYSDDELAAVLEAVRTHQPRYYPCILFLASSGWSISEALALEWSNIDKDRRTANRLRGKTGTPTMLPLNDVAMEAIILARTFTGSVFPSLTRSGVSMAIRRAKRQAGLGFHVSLHAFRHTVAVNLTRAGVPLAVVAQCLGNTTRTVLMYYQTFAPGSGKPAMDAWANQIKGHGTPVAPNAVPFRKSL
jgi:integrase